ncbi:LETM1 domain-containing protein LETM2, mitochondrial [Manis javanica]|nr:LETM1 domain-containing protein LETM2, mitochondrial [Manis javanica]
MVTMVTIRHITLSVGFVPLPAPPRSRKQRRPPRRHCNTQTTNTPRALQPPAALPPCGQCQSKDTRLNKTHMKSYRSKKYTYASQPGNKVLHL